MKANELRIGNLVYETGDGVQDPLSEIVKVYEIRQLENVTYINNCNKSFFKPIPLTGERLLELGLTKTKTGYNLESIDEHGFGQILFEFEYRDGELEPYRYYYGYHLDYKLEFVHQFQNYYFALTGKELEHESK